MFNGFHNGMGAGGWVLMALVWMTVVALIAVVVARLLPTRSGGHQDASKVPAERSREILDRRLARGEIDVQTYEELQEKLDSRALAETG